MSPDRGEAWDEDSSLPTPPAGDLEEDPVHRFIAEVERDGRLDARELDDWVMLLAATDEAAAEWLASAGDVGLSVTEAPEWLTNAVCRWQVVSPLALHAARAASLGQQYESAIEWLELRDANLKRPSVLTAADGESMALYYRTIALHQLVQLKEASRAAEALLALGPEAAAKRHRHLARLVLRDAEGAEEDSLGYVAKMMNDSRRRLSLGWSGGAERELQQDIVDRLDKTLEELEEQQRKQQQQQQTQGGSPSQGSTPMEQSQPGQLKGAGDVDNRNVPPGGDWGSLPPAERERVTQQIIRDFPGHYRALIEQYFRSLADPEAAADSMSDQAHEANDR